jgi:hypothetical protein
MNNITIFLSTQCQPPVEDGFEKMLNLSQQVLKHGLSELDAKLECDTWCFVPMMYSMCDPYPEMTASIEVDDYYYYDDLPEDVIRTFKKHWNEMMNKFCSKSNIRK